MNLNAPDVAPLANWCITALLCQVPVTFDDVPKHFDCTEATFTAVMEEIVQQINTGAPSVVH